MPHALIGWLPVWKKSSCPFKKFTLPAQEIHLARSWKHCTNKILKETKVYNAKQCPRKALFEWVLLSWRNKLQANATFQGEDNAEQNSNKNGQEKVFSAWSFLQSQKKLRFNKAI